MTQRATCAPEPVRAAWAGSLSSLDSLKENTRSYRCARRCVAPDRCCGRRSGTFGRADDAARWVDEERGIVDEGDWIAPEKGRTLFREWVDRWAARRLDIGASTKARDASLMSNHLLPAFGDRPLDSITQED